VGDEKTGGHGKVETDIVAQTQKKSSESGRPKVLKRELYIWKKKAEGRPRATNDVLGYSRKKNGEERGNPSRPDQQEKKKGGGNPEEDQTRDPPERREAKGCEPTTRAGSKVHAQEKVQLRVSVRNGRAHQRKKTPRRTKERRSSHKKKREEKKKTGKEQRVESE